MSNALKDKLLEVELFVGEKLQDYTNEQVIEKVRKEFGLQMYVNHAEELQTPQKDKSIQCPEQIGLTNSCGSCGLCWEQPKRQIVFKTH